MSRQILRLLPIKRGGEYIITFFGSLEQSAIIKSLENYDGRIYMARIIDSENTNIVGKNIRYHRKKRHMTQQAMSNKLELLGVYVCRGSVSRIEYGVRTVTDIELLAIARVLEVSVNDLFEGNEHYFD